MKKLYICLMFVFLLITLNIYAQDQEWINLNPFKQPPGNTLYDVDFVDSLHGWAVGEWGIILHTDDGGQNWQVQQNHTIDYHLGAIDFIDLNYGWAVGDFGLILFTNNGGQTWEEQTSSTMYPLNDIAFVNDSVGWAVGYGGLVLNTKDKGKTWHTQTTPTEHELRAVFFVSQDSGWISGTNGTILRTVDGGENWIIQNSTVENTIVDIDFVDPLHGWGLQSYDPEKGLLRTEDGGETWQVFPSQEGYHYALDAVSDKECWIVGRDGINGLIKYTNNGGKSWQIQNTGTEKYDYFHDVFFINNTKGWTVGTPGIILHTENGGQNWSVQQKQNLKYTLWGTFKSAFEGWIIAWGLDPLYQTKDGGITWQIQTLLDSTYFYDIWSVDNKNGWAKAYYDNPFGPDKVPYLLKTNNCGDTWQKVSSPPVSAFHALTFLDSLTGYSGGENSIYNTIDGGITWQPGIIQPGTRFGITDIFFVDRQNGWAVGGSSEAWDMGIILKTIDGGNIWQVVIPEAAVTGMAVFFTDTLCGYAVGSNPPFFMSVIMSTKDGGNTWNTQYISDITGGSWINDVVFINDSTGWCVGDYGYIWYTDNAGSSWQRVHSGTHADLNRIVFVDKGRVGYIFGDDNTLLKLEREINSIGSRDPNLPSSFRLYQNYPNPFNPITTIKFNLPKTSEIMLKIFNILGEEVATLVSDRLTAGSYSYEWSRPAGMASGVYLYKLEAGDYVETRKMVLMK